ncbi:cell division protein SepF [Ligilactobacillus cholophilus]|uniref:cell division protein SepF n=1 Tax=Ligilactobacillus cholophilus TaxID=3050131 RepID=UPI0025AFE5E1|nr:cell division protein SepF [Ligilactobacillus cholophilus]
MSLGERINRFFEGYDADEEKVNDQQTSKTTSIKAKDEFARDNSRGNKVMSIVSRNEHSEKKIMLFEPRVFSDVKQISTRLLDGQAAIVNFQRMDNEQIHRVVDFLSGVVFATDGDIKRLGEEIFLCTPADYSVEGMLTETNFQDL